MNDITAAILSDFPNSWICRSIITYLSRGEVSISQIGGSGSGKKAHRRQSGFEKAAHQFTSNINAVSPPRPLHLSQLQLSLRRQILNTQILCLDFQRISTISLNHEDRVNLTLQSNLEHSQLNSQSLGHGLGRAGCFFESLV